MTMTMTQPDAVIDGIDWTDPTEQMYIDAATAFIEAHNAKSDLTIEYEVDHVRTYDSGAANVYLLVNMVPGRLYAEQRAVNGISLGNSYPRKTGIKLTIRVRPSN